MTSTNGEGRPLHRAGLAKSEAAKLTDAPHSTARGLTVDASEVLCLEAELAEILGRPVSFSEEPAVSTQAALTDHERLALSLVDTFGPSWSRKLAAELVQAADEIAPRRPWGGAP